MAIISNGDFSNGLTGWTTVGAGDTAPTYDAANGWVVFGSGNNDVQDGDRLSQQVALQAGQSYTLTFSIRELGSASGGFGITVDLEDTGGGSGFTTIGSAQVFDEQTNSVTITFTSPYDNPILRFRGQFGFGGTSSLLILDDIAISCFVRGTLINTPSGLVPVEDLVAGDEVITLDDGPKMVRWSGSQKVNSLELRLRPDLRPILIPQGAMKCTSTEILPARDLRVSPAHRILVSGPMVELVSGNSECFVPASQLVGVVEGVRRDNSVPDEGVEYFHILFDTHQIVWSDGLPTESFHPALQAVSAYEENSRDEILDLFPDLALIGDAHMPLARPILKGYETRAALYK